MWARVNVYTAAAARRLFRFSFRVTHIEKMSTESGVASKSGQPHWERPEGPSVTKLKLYNSLTRKKEEFTPLNGRQVLWYSCGPTVYDASHMGHARSYITFDILRRVLKDYFNYDILYVMNITDIDDKIIRRARRNHLMEEYQAKVQTTEEVVHDVEESLQVFKEKAQCEIDPDKKAMMTSTLDKCEAVLGKCKGGKPDKEELLKAATDPLSAWLDHKFGSEVKDHGIFSKLTRHWEEEYHRDMTALNILPPDVLTRVSEYVPEVITYVQRIIDNGFAYESNGSVYFDVPKFSSSPDHQYAKLVPEAVGDTQALAEGEGVLSLSDDKLQEKRSKNDFALWKASKLGEPAWPSPWGCGRPGWHIECSVMACDILGEQADIHTGGVDLKFPHHDNEIAQAEAHYGHDQWMSYFLHSGHLTIEGCKMSKSLKNFITIKQALEQYSSRQLRLAFLLHSWTATLDYSEQTMKEALHWEKMFNEFFLRVKDLVRKQPTGVNSYCKFEEREKQLNSKFMASQRTVHDVLCDSIDTLAVMKILRDVISACNVYMSQGGSSPINARLVDSIAHYVTYVLSVFGVIPLDSGIGFPVEGESGANVESVLLPLASLIASFREDVRRVALENKTTSLLKLCDHLRDNQLPELGVVLEDKDGQTVVKYIGKEAAKKEREKAQRLIAEKQKVKEEQRRKQEEARAKKEREAAIPPQEWFRKETDKYSQFDEQGIPTHDASGQPITDSQRKKLRKIWQTQEKKHQDYLSKKQ